MKIAFTIFLISLISINIFGLVEVGSQLDLLEQSISYDLQWTKDQHYINELFHRTLNVTRYIRNDLNTSAWNDPANIGSNVDYEAIWAVNRNISKDYIITFDPDILVPLKDEGGKVQMVRLNQALI